MRKIKRLFCLLLVCCLLIGSLSVSVSAAQAKFSDVKAGDWFYDAVIKSAEKGIVAGNNDGSYDPEGTLTWAQTITFAVRLDQYRKGDRIYGNADQTGSRWYDVYFDYALAKGIISVAPASPNAPITRADAAIIFSKVLGSYNTVNDISDYYFSDVPYSHAAYDAIYALARAGICNGKSAGVFGVRDNFKRNEVATIVARMAGLVNKVVLLSSAELKVFTQLDGKVFNYSHSTGKGTSTFTVDSNGYFSGQYKDVRPAESGVGYEKGTIYLCNFTGRFTNISEVDSRSYTLSVADLSTSALPGKVVYQDGYRYISTEAYGFENAGIFDLFLGGSFTASMPECLLNSLIIANDWGKSVPGRCAAVILHNRNAHKAFIEDIPAGVSAATLFSVLEGKTFTYTSGAGAWHTTITFGSGGNFEGTYYDANMGETGKNYPGGTVYQSSFYGALGDSTWQENCHYSLRLRYLYLHNNNLGSENIVDGVRYVVTGATGFEKAGYFSLYVPGYNTAKAPEPMRKWLSALEGWGDKFPNSIPCWTLYNIGGETTFFSYD